MEAPYDLPWREDQGPNLALRGKSGQRNGRYTTFSLPRSHGGDLTVRSWGMSDSQPETVHVHRDGPTTVVTIDRPEVRNAVDRPTADALEAACAAFDADDGSSVAVRPGAGGAFCAGADLKGISDGRGNRVDADIAAPGPMGPTRMRLSKPVVAAIEGPAVAGGLELALWCDLRVAATDAVLGVYCRRWGVPLIDGGTVRLPRLIGHSRALEIG